MALVSRETVALDSRNNGDIDIHIEEHPFTGTSMKRTIHFYLAGCFLGDTDISVF
jgi:hypothetical protein